MLTVYQCNEGQCPLTRFVGGNVPDKCPNCRGPLTRKQIHRHAGPRAKRLALITTNGEEAR